MAVRAAIDCGSNTTRLLIVRDDGEALERELAYTRLGQGVQATGRLDDQAIARCREALTWFSQLLAKHQVEKVGVFATSAVRDAANSQEFLVMVEQIVGSKPQVLSGEDEARLTFLGATSGLPEGDYALIDIGGGSTEFAWRAHNSGTLTFSSIDVGALRITESCLSGDPPTETELMAAQGAISEAFGPVVRPLGNPTLVGVAGTVTTMAALNLGLKEYNRDAVHGSKLSRAEIFRWSETLVADSVEARIARGVPEGRAHVIAAGALILDLACEVFGFDQVVVSENDNLDGQVILLDKI